MARENNYTRSGRGRGRFHGGRGRGNGRNSKRNTQNKRNTDRNNMKDIRFYPHSVGRQQTVTFSTVRDKIIGIIQRNYDYGVHLAKELRDEKKFDVSTLEPMLQESNETDLAKKALEEKQFARKYDIEVEQYIKQKYIIEDNNTKACALIWDHCSKQIQQRLESHADYKRNMDKPLEILRLIKKLMHDPERAKYGYASLLQAMKTFVNISQLEYENLLDYQKRVKQSSEISSSHLREGFLDGFVEKLPEFSAASDAATQDAMKAKAFKAFTSYVI